MISTVALFVAASAVAVASFAQKDIHYVPHGATRQDLDVYAPKEGKNHPVVFWIHGGGWQSGDKSEVDAKPQAFVERGYVFVSTNYRLLPDATIHQMAQDLAKSLRWTYDHAGEYGGDPHTLVVTGHSAGAQLAALLCTDERYLQAEGLSLANVKACIPVDGDTYNVPLQIATVEERRANLYRQKFGDEASQKDLSPVTHVARGKHIPPVLILHVADHPETTLQSHTLVKALTEAGVPARACAAENTDHVKLNADLGLPSDKPSEVMFHFIKEVLGKR